MTPEKLGRIINNKVQHGTSWQEVISFLDSMKIEHSTYDKEKKVIKGILRDTSGNFLIKGSIVLQFFFDEKGQMMNYTIKEIFTGP